VLGFNKAIKVVNTRGNLSAEYIVLTDGDIVVPSPENQVVNNLRITYLMMALII
jgi:hypothetical protein